MRSILGLGNMVDAIEILAIGFILAVMQDEDHELTRGQQSMCKQCNQLLFFWYQCVLGRCVGGCSVCGNAAWWPRLWCTKRSDRTTRKSTRLIGNQCRVCIAVVVFSQCCPAQSVPRHWRNRSVILLYLAMISNSLEGNALRHWRHHPSHLHAVL